MHDHYKQTFDIFFLTLGKYWQSPKTCQHSKCNEKFSVRSCAVRDEYELTVLRAVGYKKRPEVTGTHVINFKLAREIKATVVGSRTF